MSENADGKSVVIKDGHRMGSVHETKVQAEAEVERLKKLTESQGGKGGTVQVKTQIQG